MLPKTPPYSGGYKLRSAKEPELTVLEPYVVGEDNRKFHKIQLSDGTVGYVLAYDIGSGNNADT